MFASEKLGQTLTTYGFDAGVLTKEGFNNKNIRVVKVDNEIYFVGKDIAEALEYTNPNKAIRDLVTAEYKGETEMDTPGGKQRIVIVSIQKN